MRIKKRSKISCCIPICTNTSESIRPDDSVTFHVFPAQPERRNKWLEICFGDKASNYVHKTLIYICSNHFKAEDFKKTTIAFAELIDFKRKRKLNSDCVPSLNLYPHQQNENYEYEKENDVQDFVVCSDLIHSDPDSILGNKKEIVNHKEPGPLTNFRECQKRINDLLARNEELLKCPVHETTKANCSLKNCFWETQDIESVTKNEESTTKNIESTCSQGDSETDSARESDQDVSFLDDLDEEYENVNLITVGQDLKYFISKCKIRTNDIQSSGNESEIETLKHINKEKQISKDIEKKSEISRDINKKIQTSSDIINKDHQYISKKSDISKDINKKIHTSSDIISKDHQNVNKETICENGKMNIEDHYERNNWRTNEDELIRLPYYKILLLNKKLSTDTNELDESFKTNGVKYTDICEQRRQQQYTTRRTSKLNNVDNKVCQEGSRTLKKISRKKENRIETEQNDLIKQLKSTLTLLKRNNSRLKTVIKRKDLTIRKQYLKIVNHETTIESHRKEIRKANETIRNKIKIIQIQERIINSTEDTRTSRLIKHRKQNQNQGKKVNIIKRKSCRSRNFEQKQKNKRIISRKRKSMNFNQNMNSMEVDRETNFQEIQNYYDQEQTIQRNQCISYKQYDSNGETIVTVKEEKNSDDDSNDTLNNIENTRNTKCKYQFNHVYRCQVQLERNAELERLIQEQINEARHKTKRIKLTQLDEGETFVLEQNEYNIEFISEEIKSDEDSQSDDYDGKQYEMQYQTQYQEEEEVEIKEEIEDVEEIIDHDEPLE